MEHSQGQKKGFITEEDISSLLQRYSAAKVLDMLQEVAQSTVGVKIDWDALVKNTSTGISNAREYQMVWRHIAYCHELLDKVDDDAEPLDEDSDLEYEVEAFPAVSDEATTEAVACVKVLSGSGLPGDPNAPNGSTVEAPLTINIPNRLSSKSPLENHASTSSMQRTNIMVPVSVQNQSIPMTPSVQKQSASGNEGADTNGYGNSNIPSRRKRKPWSEEEDMELIAAVRKCGEGNWANILKGDFKGDRTASQLSQRWAIIRKKQNNMNIGSNTAGLQLSEAQLAARRAIHMALKDTAMTVGNGAPGSNSSPASMNTSHEGNQSANNPASHARPQHLQPVGSNPKPLALPPIFKSRAPSKMPAPKSMASSESSMVTAVAMAAGARIASPSDAASLFKAAQANNAIHIKSSIGSNTNPFSSTHLGAHRNAQLNFPAMGPMTSPSLTSIGPTLHTTGSQPVRANYVRPTGPATTQLGSRALTTPTSANQSNNTLLSQFTKAPTTSPMGLTAECTNNTTSYSANGPPVRNEISSEENKALPQLGSIKTQNVEAKINPAPVLSCAELAVTSDMVAVEEFHSAEGADKKKEEAENAGCHDNVHSSIKSQIIVNSSNGDNQPLLPGKRKSRLYEQHEELAKGKSGDPQSLRNEVSSQNVVAAEEVKAGAKLLEQKKSNDCKG